MCALLLTTKMMPPPLPDYLVERPRLLEALEIGLRTRLMLLSAPPGYGKTTLLSHWFLQPRYEHTGWIRLDERDNDPQRFAQYLQRCLPVMAGVESELDRPDFAGGDMLLEDLLTGLINHIATGVQTGCILALDDYHVITNPEIHQAMKFWLTHMPPAARLVISTRTTPPFPLAQMRSADQVYELRSGDLAFTLEETSRFFDRQTGIDCGSAEVARLQDQVEGWAAGLQLAALSMRGKGLEANGLPAAGGMRYISDYLAEQVFQTQPPQVQNFLLQTSVLERMNGSICEAVCLEEGLLSANKTDPPGAGQAMLEYLEQNNLFISPLVAESGWYRYHPLFAGFLRSRLENSSQRTLQCHLKAALWLEQHDLSQDAMRHYREAQQVDPDGKYLAQLFQSGGLHSRLFRDAKQRKEIHLIGNLFNMAGSLSDRELQVLRLMANGMTYAEIAQELFIAVSTVQTHVKNTYYKLDVHNGMEAVARARQLHLLT
jgi:LuxR family maltose regulon positive regulatory protein